MNKLAGLFYLVRSGSRATHLKNSDPDPTNNEPDSPKWRNVPSTDLVETNVNFAVISEEDPDRIFLRESCSVVTTTLCLKFILNLKCCFVAGK